MSEVGGDVRSAHKGLTHGDVLASKCGVSADLRAHLGRWTSARRDPSPAPICAARSHHHIPGVNWRERCDGPPAIGDRQPRTCSDTPQMLREMHFQMADADFLRPRLHDVVRIALRTRSRARSVRRRRRHRG